MLKDESFPSPSIYNIVGGKLYNRIGCFSFKTQMDINTICFLSYSFTLLFPLLPLYMYMVAINVIAQNLRLSQNFLAIMKMLLGKFYLETKMLIIAPI